MGSELGTVHTRRLTKAFCSEFPVDRYSPVEGQREQRSKHLDNNNKDESNRPNINKREKKSVLFRLSHDLAGGAKFTSLISSSMGRRQFLELDFK